jgi:hypothetical protein
MEDGRKGKDGNYPARKDQVEGSPVQISLLAIMFEEHGIQIMSNESLLA